MSSEHLRPFVAILPTQLRSLRQQPMPRLTFSRDEMKRAFVDLPEPLIEPSLLEQRTRQMIESFHGWLKPKLADAAAAGMDFAVRRVEHADERYPWRNPELQWTTTFRWEGGPVEAGTEMGPGWTVYRCSSGGASPD